MNKLYSLGFLLNRASFSLAKDLKNELNLWKIDLTHSQFVVLRCLYIEDKISQREIAQLLSKDASAIKRTLDILEQKGLVKRIALTQRENSISITERGNEIFPKAELCAKRVLDRVIDKIGEQHYDLLKGLLNKMYNE